MTLSISYLTYDRKAARLVVICDTDLELERVRLRIDGINQPGRFIATGIYGNLYRHSPDVWGVPDLGFGPSRASLLYTTPSTDFGVGNPPSTLGTEKTTPEALLPLLWDAGFHDPTHLLYGVAIARGESGFYLKARNWLPSQSFRPAGDVLGVGGPPAAWNKDHSQQGSSDRGIFQVNWHYHHQFSDVQCDTPAEACKVLWAMTGGGVDWTAWGFGQGGAHYEQFFAELKPKVDVFLATKGP